MQVAVFNDSLLALGAAISTTSVNADIAQTILSVIENMTSGDPGSVPASTPLSQIGVTTSALFTQAVARDAGAGPEEAR